MSVVSRTSGAGVKGRTRSGSFGSEGPPDLTLGGHHISSLNFSDSSAEDEEGDEEGETGPFSRGLNVCTLLQKLIQSQSWAVLVMAVIFLNTLVLAIQCDHPWSVWDQLEDAFLVFFTIEIALRLLVHRQQFFTDPIDQGWNIFDFIIVVTGLCERVLTGLMKPSDDDDRAGVLELRVMRIMRVLRTCRMIRHFQNLNMLVHGFMQSMQAVFWIAVLFVCFVFVAGIICTTIVGQHAEDWGPENGGTDEDMDSVTELFGTLLTSMVTMFQMVTLDDWADIIGLVGKRSSAMTIFFIVYTLVTAFAMIALLTGVMTESVTSVSSQHEKKEKDKGFQHFIDTLESVFRHTDTGEDGLTEEEFGELLQRPEVAQGMSLNSKHFKIPSHEDLTDIFRSLDISGDGKVSWDEFRAGLKYVQGPATARQVCLLRGEVNSLTETVKAALLKPHNPAQVAQVGTHQRLHNLSNQLAQLERVLAGTVGSPGPGVQRTPSRGESRPLRGSL